MLNREILSGLSKRHGISLSTDVLIKIHTQVSYLL